MKRIICLTVVALLLLAGCNTGSGDSSSTPGATAPSGDGVYEATANGYGGELKIEVVADGDTMTDIRIVYDAETNVVFDRAFPVIRERILEAQSPIVDSVSGATYSSFAVKAAVAEAAKGFGKDFGAITLATEGPETPERELDPVNTEVLVVGAGPAGLAAAISAKEAGVENVILIEKLDILSGNGKFDMNFFDLVNSEAQRKNGTEDTVEAFVEEKANALDSAERVQAWAEGSYELDAWLRTMGVELNYNYGLRNHMAEEDRYAGEHIQEMMEARVFGLGVDVRTGTKGLDLITEDGKVVGVKVRQKNDTYDIYADAVILATGGFAHNKDLLAQYVPGSERLATSNQMGATGDLIPVFIENGYAMDNMEVLSVFKMIIKNRRDLTGAGDGFILVNRNGERFADESSSGLPLAYEILDQPGGEVYYIYDQALYESFYRLKKHNALGYHVKADTPEELAALLGIDGDNLAEAIATYNSAVAGEIDDPFRANAFTRPLEGPFYGVQVESAIHMTKGGVVADEHTRVITVDGDVVEGLFAAGEVTATSAAYSGSVVFGRIAGEEAAKYIAG